MDASMMGSMAGMGMDMGSVGMFFDTDSALARTFWYIIAGAVFLAVLLNGVRACDVWWRRRISRTKSITNPTRPRNAISQCYATATAIVREATYPQPISFAGRWFAWLSPPPLGRLLLLFFYWAMIIGILTWKSIAHDAYYWERVGFRAAWVSVTQVPLVYLLVSKTLGLILGLSYERLNWLHRWVSRTLLITVTLHGAFFLAEWARADFVAMELKLMPMVRYGLGAWAVLVWILVTSFAPFRNMAYELFVLQHLAAAGIFLWLVYRHVPSYAVYNVWFAVGIVAFDRAALFCWSVYRNIVVRKRGAKPSSSKWLGYRAELQALNRDITMVTLRDVAFKWKVGQHIYLRLPKIGILESHPFTISSIPSKSSSPTSNDVCLIIRAHSGFTRRLQRRALDSLQGDAVVMTAFVAGPFGAPPAWNSFETLVLIAASTGASFTLPILESVIEDPCCVQSIDFLLLVRQREQSDYYAERLRSAIPRAAAKGIRLRVEIAVTCEQISCTCCDFGSDKSGKETRRCRCKANCSAEAALAADPSGGPIPSPPRSVSSDGKMVDEITEKKSSSGSDSQTSRGQSFVAETPGVDIEYTYGRPDITAAIRLPVEAAAGEASVAVCGGRELVAAVRNYVAALSDERAVHKGSGAQGIHLHVEGYCF